MVMVSQTVALIHRHRILLPGGSFRAAGIFIARARGGGARISWALLIVLMVNNLIAGWALQRSFHQTKFPQVQTARDFLSRIPVVDHNSFSFDLCTPS